MIFGCYRRINRFLLSVFRIRILWNPDLDPAKKFNPDPEDLESGFGSKLFLDTI